MGCIEGDAVPEKVRNKTSSLLVIIDQPQFVPQMISWYREGKFPIDKLVQTYEVRSILESAWTPYRRV